jgi:hypothetical protein
MNLLLYRASNLLARLVGCLPKPILARAVARIAKTGRGSDECLKWECLPMPVDCYSPVPDIADLDRRSVWSRRNELRGVDFRPDAQSELLRELGRWYGDECSWPAVDSGDGRFYVNNGAFSFGCAASTHCMVRHLKPSTVIEVGSGFSTLVINEALRMNRNDTGRPFRHVVVDPAASSRLTATGSVEVMKMLVQEYKEEAFGILRANDILFIDSGHTVRIGGDVNYLYLDILPQLQPGVVIHAHDIPFPAEYPRCYATAPAFRVFWTEAYLLQAFLAFNTEFRVLLGMHYLETECSDLFRKAFPHYDPVLHGGKSASFWFQRVA